MNRLLLILTLTILTVLNIFAQGQPASTTSDKSVLKNDREATTFNESEKKLYASYKNPPEYIANLSKILNQYPYQWQIEGIVLISLRDVLKNVGAEETNVLLSRLIKDTEQAEPALKTMLYSSGANILFRHKLYEDAVELSQKNIPLLNEAEFIEYQRKIEAQNNADNLIKNPNAKLESFDLSRAKDGFIGLKTRTFNILGKSFWETGKYELSEKAYRKSFAVSNTKDAALGIAKSAEKTGKNEEALKYATAAVLTGKLLPSEMDYFNLLYAKFNQGKTANVEAYLDAEFKKTYRNPVKNRKYQRTPKRSSRTTLVEFFTGAGCFPCKPFDYTFEKVLSDYSSKEVAVLAYHWHAPTMDPLGNHSSDSRVKYYGIKGAPIVYIDGEKYEDDSDYYGNEDEQSEIQPIADGVYKTLNSDLEIPAAAEIKLKAKRKGEKKIAVQIDAGKLKNASEDATLQIALVENETSYSGENGLRFHFMVVRALAGDNEKREFGFKIDTAKSNKFDYVFDIDKIVVQNFAYYETHTAERTKEFLDRVKAKSLDGFGIDFKFNYQKNQINPKHLSVIAYLQDNKTKKILQSSVINLASK